MDIKIKEPKATCPHNVAWEVVLDNIYNTIYKCPNCGYRRVVRK